MKRLLPLFAPLLLVFALLIVLTRLSAPRPSSNARSVPPSSAGAPPVPATAPAGDVAWVAKRLPRPLPDSFWSLAGEPAGNEGGLAGPAAATSRGAGDLPAGRRYRIEGFPDLRSLEEGENVRIALPDGRSFDGRVNYSKRDDGYADTHQVAIGFNGARGGLVATDNGGTGTVAGRLLVQHDRIAWTLETGDGGDLWLVERLREDLVCEMPTPPVAARSAPLAGDPDVTGSGSVAPTLNSRSSASAVLYLDFDGQPTQTYPDWPSSNPGGVNIVVPHSGLNADEMTTFWRRVAEDFAPFNINVTTEVAKYTAASVGSKMRILVASTLPAGVNGAGLAYFRSFRANSGFSSNVPCWLEVAAYPSASLPFSSAQLSSLASNATHEFGHTLGLAHDGDDGVQPVDGGGSYYEGHGTEPFDWSAIMGSPYRSGSTARGILQWAKNDYPGANNSQDDLAIIAGSSNGFGYRSDESTSLSSSDPLEPLGPNQVGAEGVVANRNDLDWWSFQVPRSGAVTVTVEPADRAVTLPNLDCGFRIENTSGTTIAGGFHFEDNLTSEATVNLAPGTYHVVAYGTGNRQFSDGTGYDDYGSVGRYLVTVDLPPDVTAPLASVVSPAPDSVLTSNTLEFHGTASDDDHVSALAIYLRRNSDNAWWNGSYWQIGSSGAGLTWTYDTSAKTWTCTDNLPQVGGGSSGSLGGGSYAFIVIAEDPAGNSTQAEAEVTVDSSGPGTSIAAPASGSTIGAPEYGFNGVVGDSGGIAGLSLYIRRAADGFYWNGSTWQDGVSGAALASERVSIPLTGFSQWFCTSPLPQLGSTFPPGTYNFIAIGIDSLGNTQQVDSVVAVDGAPPATTISQPLAGSTITSKSLPFFGTITDNGGVNRLVLFLRRQSDGLYWDGTNWISEALSANLSAAYDAEGGTWWCDDTLPVPGASMPNGAYSFIAIGIDHAGNEQQVDSAVTVNFHQVYHWTAGSWSDEDQQNNNDYWGNPANWSPYGVPAGDDIVNIDISRVVRSSVSRSVYGFNISTGSVDFDDSSHSLNITNHGAWTGGSFADNLNIGAGATFEISGGGFKSLATYAAVRNSGTIIWLGGHRVRGDQYCTWQNLAGGTFEIAVDGDPFGTIYGGNVFINEPGATLVKTGGNAPGAASLFDQINVVNRSEIRAQTGTLRFHTTVDLEAGSHLAGNGRILFTGTVHLPGEVTSSGNPELAGTLIGTQPAATFSGSRPLVWTSGTISGSFSVAAGSVLQLRENHLKILATSTVFNNRGRVTWLAGQLRGDQYVTFNNNAGAVFDITTDGDVFADVYGGNVFNNETGALLIKSGKSGDPEATTFLDEWTFNNRGTIRAEDGVIRFHAPLNLLDGGSIARNGSQPARVRSTYQITSTGTTVVSGLVFECKGDWHGNTAADTIGNGTIATANGGVFEWTGGGIFNTVNIAPGADFQISGEDLKRLSTYAVLNNRGHAFWTGGGAIRGDQYATINNLAAATFTIATDAGFTDIYGGNVFSNAAGAVLEKTGGSGTTHCDWAIHNAGLLRATSGIFSMRAGGSSTGDFAPLAGGEVRFAGGHHNLAAPANLTGTGIVRITGGTVHASDKVESGIPAGLLEISSGLVTSSSGGSFGVFGNVRWTGGSIGGIFNIAPGTSFSMVGEYLKSIDTYGVINNHGNTTWNGPGHLRGVQYSTWNNKEGSSFIVATDGDVLDDIYGGHHFNNETGAIFMRATPTTGESSVDSWTFNNTGIIGNDTGTLRFSNTLNLGDGSTIAGDGRVLLHGTTNLSGILGSSGHPELVGTLNANAPLAAFSGETPFIWSAGTITGKFTLLPGSHVELTSENVKSLATYAEFDNFGRVTWRAGSLRGVQYSVFNNEAGGVFDAVTDGDVLSNIYGGNVFRNKPGGLFLKSGNNGVAGGSTYIDEWTFDNAGGMIRSDDGLLRFHTELLLNPGGVITSSGAATSRVLSSHYFVLSGTTTVVSATFETSGDWHGTIAEGSSGNGTIATAAGGVFEWTGGSVHNTVNIAPGAIFSITGPNLRQIATYGVINNRGIATRTGTGELRGAQYSSFTNHPEGVFNIHTAAPFTNYLGGNRLTNAGVMNIGPGAATASLHWGFTQSATGRLNLEIAGPDAAAPEFGQFHVHQDAVLDGTLGITLANSYVPPADTAFPVLAFASCSGTFAAIHSPGALWDPQYNSNNLTLVAQAQPTELAGWTALHFDDPGSADAGPGSDPDKDGLTNLLEYALGGNPHTGGSSGITTGSVFHEGQNHLSLSYVRPAALTDVTYTGERSTGLAAGDWSAAGVAVHAIVPVPGEDKETVTLRSTQPLQATAKEFLHLKIEVATPAP